jgi:hypothetical protein
MVARWVNSTLSRFWPIPHRPKAAWRVFHTLQDRLVKALRLVKHNARFEVPALDSTNAHRAVDGNAQDLSRICVQHYERALSKTLTCQFKGKLIVLVTRPEQSRYALRKKTIKVIEHFDGELELLWERQALPFKTSDQHQHLSSSRVAADKLLNVRVDQVLIKKSARLRKLQVKVAAENQSPRSNV